MILALLITMIFSSKHMKSHHHELLTAHCDDTKCWQWCKVRTWCWTGPKGGCNSDSDCSAVQTNIDYNCY